MECNDDNDDVEDYNYEILTTPRSIRLVEIHPGEVDDDLQCSIWHYQLKEAPPFEALSYRWRDHHWLDLRPLESAICWNQDPEHAPSVWFDEEFIELQNQKSAGEASELAHTEVIYRLPAPVLKVRGFRLDTILQLDEPCRRFEFYRKDVIRSWPDIRPPGSANPDSGEAREPAAQAITSPSKRYLDMMFNDDGFFRPEHQAQQGTEARVRGHVTGRRFVVTQGGRMGLGTLEAEVGDLVCIFLGGRTPFVLRPQHDDTYELIGECLINSVMQDEALLDVPVQLHEEFMLR